MKNIVQPLILLTFGLLISCKKDTHLAKDVMQHLNAQSIQIEAIPLLQHSVQPNVTDTAITTNTNNSPLQTAYLPANVSSRKDKLFIFIPGTGGTPSGFDKIISAAANAGYYSFGIAYSNLTAIEKLAGDNPNDTTVEDILEEYLSGNNVSAKVNVSRANSFENRIIKMISYMDSLYPTEDWKRFLNSNKTLIWKKISVAGHSQGSDHAMYMSKKRTLLSAGFFSGPGNFRLSNGAYPSFMQARGLTSLNNISGFTHKDDPVRVWSDVKKTWQTLGLLKLPESVDDEMIDSASRKFFTTRVTNSAHLYVITDGTTPLDENGNPLFQFVWQSMCFP